MGLRSFEFSSCKNVKRLVPWWTVTTRTVAVWATVLGGNDVEAWEVAHVHSAEHVLGIGIDLNALLDLEVDGGDVRNVIETLLTLLFLELEGDALHWSTGDALHHVGGESSDLVAKTLGWDHGNLIADALVGGEIHGETLVIALNDFLGSTLDGLVTNTALRSRATVSRDARALLAIVKSARLRVDTGLGCCG